MSERYFESRFIEYTGSTIVQAGTGHSKKPWPEIENVVTLTQHALKF